jgi:hypothetical protein
MMLLTTYLFNSTATSSALGPNVVLSAFFLAPLPQIPYSSSGSGIKLHTYTKHT